jgi:hypothetical protein
MIIDQAIQIPHGTPADDFAKQQLEIRWQGDTFEWIAVYDPTNPVDLYLCTEQNTGSCGVSNSLEAILLQNASVLHHNHPSSAPLSPGDYVNFQDYPLLREIWAHGHNGSAWSHMVIAQPLPKQPVGHAPQTLIESFATAINYPVWDSIINSAFRQGFANAIAALTGGTYTCSVQGTPYANHVNDPLVSNIVKCSGLVTTECFQIVSDPASGSTGLSDVFCCIEHAFAHGKYQTPIFNLQTMSTRTRQLYTTYCLPLENWIRSTFP